MIKGIGQNLAKALNEAGIHTFAQIAASDEATLANALDMPGKNDAIIRRLDRTGHFDILPRPSVLAQDCNMKRGASGLAAHISASHSSLTASSKTISSSF